MDMFESDNKELTESEARSGAPLADRMRPATFDEFAGQIKVVGAGTPLRKSIEADRVASSIFWGPPGTGKTTIAELIARSTHGQFIPFSAVTTSIKDIKAIISKSGNYFRMSGKRTYIFVDEIHRFNKAQQDAFLPYVEKGDIVLIGATTENPSFEVNSALLSRMRVYVLERLQPDEIRTVLMRAINDSERGVGSSELNYDDRAIDMMCEAADGDARRALSLLEAIVAFVGKAGSVTGDIVKEVHQKSVTMYDKAGEEHYNLISALHKSIRGGDPDASLYWLARMLEAGEEPMYIIRRLVRFAAEDIGLADPYALTLTLNARDSYHFLGSPEGELSIAMAVIYMACAPKSNAMYTAFKRATNDAQERGSLPVPLHIRNAPTSLMKDIGYGKGYQYAHDHDDALTGQEHFPDELAGSEYYQPTKTGREKFMFEYLEKYREYRQSHK